MVALGGVEQRLLGMQPTLRHVPPRYCFSTQGDRALAGRADGGDVAAEPAITTRSKVLVVAAGRSGSRGRRFYGAGRRGARSASPATKSK